jgi:hypothetical protein
MPPLRNAMRRLVGLRRNVPKSIHGHAGLLNHRFHADGCRAGGRTASAGTLPGMDEPGERCEQKECNEGLLPLRENTQHRVCLSAGHQFACSHIVTHTGLTFAESTPCAQICRTRAAINTGFAATVFRLHGLSVRDPEPVPVLRRGSTHLERRKTMENPVE